MLSDSLKAVKDFLEQAKDSAIDKATELTDANGDGVFDIQDIIIFAFKAPGVHIKRESFLRKELFKNHPAEVVEDAITRTPALAGISDDEIEKIADEVINFERNCVSGVSLALGMPGGAAMVATVPADIIQCYGYTLRAIQKLLYLYGFPEIDSDEEGIMLDSETVNRIIVCLGVMNGVTGANKAIKAIAKALATGVEKKLLATALTKGTLFPVLRSTLKWFGVKLTREVFVKSVKDAIPIVGGVIGGGVTFLSFKPCCLKLKDVLIDTMLSNPNHISDEEENEAFSNIMSGAILEAEFEECNDDVTDGSEILEDSKG